MRGTAVKNLLNRHSSALLHLLKHDAHPAHLSIWFLLLLGSLVECVLLHKALSWRLLEHHGEVGKRCEIRDGIALPTHKRGPHHGRVTC
jgi:hypothetical protein